MKTKVIGMLNIPDRLESASRVYDTEHLSPTLNTMGGGGREPKIMEEKIKGCDFRYDESFRIRKNGCCSTIKSNAAYKDISNTPMAIAYDEQNQNIHTDGTVGTLTTDGSSPKHNNRVVEMNKNFRIRKLTPKECWRLMGFTDEDFEKAEKVVSTTQLYKQAGNSIVTNCLYHIFKEML